MSNNFTRPIPKASLDGIDDYLNEIDGLITASKDYTPVGNLHGENMVNILDDLDHVKINQEDKNEDLQLFDKEEFNKCLIENKGKDLKSFIGKKVLIRTTKYPFSPYSKATITNVFKKDEKTIFIIRNDSNPGSFVSFEAIDVNKKDETIDMSSFYPKLSIDKKINDEDSFNLDPIAK